MMFKDLKKDMILTFNYGSTERSYIYVWGFKEKSALIAEIKVFDRKQEVVLISRSEIPKFAWNDSAMTYNKYEEINKENLKKIIDFIFKYNYINID
jgi:hypothetical protein